MYVKAKYFVRIIISILTIQKIVKIVNKSFRCKKSRWKEKPKNSCCFCATFVWNCFAARHYWWNKIEPQSRLQLKSKLFDQILNSKCHCTKFIRMVCVTYLKQKKGIAYVMHFNIHASLNSITKYVYYSIICISL